MIQFNTTDKFSLNLTDDREILIKKIIGYLQVNRWTQKKIQNLGKALYIQPQSMDPTQILHLIDKKINRILKNCNKTVICLQDLGNSTNWIKQFNLQQKLNKQYEIYYPFIRTIFKLYFLHIHQYNQRNVADKDLKTQMIMKMLKYQFKERYLRLNDIKMKSYTLTIVKNQILECCLCQVYVSSENMARKIVKCKNCQNYFHPSCYRTSVQSAKFQIWPKNYRITINEEQLICDYSFPKQNKVDKRKMKILTLKSENIIKFSVKKINRGTWSYHETYPSYYLMGIFLVKKKRATLQLLSQNSLQQSQKTQVIEI